MGVLGTLKPKRGSVQGSKRVGRGRGSGKGGTAAKGHKGQKSRSGAPIPRGFEGGQTPLARRLPKFGFTNARFKTTYDVVNLGQLNRFEGEITPETLKLAGLVRCGPVKILARGELKKALNVKAHKISKKAQAAIESAGGKIEVI